MGKEREKAAEKKKVQPVELTDEDLRAVAGGTGKAYKKKATKKKTAKKKVT
jgi:hypothetical protein